MVVFSQISPLPASLSPPTPAYHPPSAFHQPASLPWVFSSILTMLLWSAAAATRTQSCFGDFIGFRLVRWMSSRIRLRRDLHRIAAASPLGTESHQGFLDPPSILGLDPAACSRSTSPSDWRPREFMGSESGLVLRFRSPSDSSVDSGERLTFPQPDQSVPMGFSSQTQKPSWPKAQASHQYRAVNSSRAIKLSRAVILSRAAKPSRAIQASQAFLSIGVCPSQPQFGLRDISNKTKRSAELRLPDDVEVAHFEPSVQA